MYLNKYMVTYVPKHRAQKNINALAYHQGHAYMKFFEGRIVWFTQGWIKKLTGLGLKVKKIGS